MRWMGDCGDNYFCNIDFGCTCWACGAGHGVVFRMTPDEMRAVNSKAKDKIMTAFWAGAFLGAVVGCSVVLAVQMIWA